MDLSALRSGRRDDVHRPGNLFGQPVVAEGAVVADVHRLGDVGGDEVLVGGVHGFLAGCEWNDEIRVREEPVEPALLGESGGDLVEQVACILNALVLLAETEDGHPFANRLGEVGPLRDLEHSEGVRRLDLLDGVAVLGILLDTVTDDGEPIDVSVRLFEGTQLLCENLEAVGVELLGNHGDDDVAGRDQGVVGEDVQGWRRVDNDVVVVLFELVESHLQPLATLWRLKQRLDVLVIREFLAGGKDVEFLVFDDDIVHRLHLVELENVEQRCTVGVVVQIIVAKRAGELAVIVDIDQEDVVASGSECAASMNDVGCLPRASLLIRHRDSCGIGVGHYLRFSRCVRFPVLLIE